MDKEFTKYEQSLALKELGFDEPCIAFYNGKFLDFKVQGGDNCSPYLSTENRGECPNAPTLSQAFRWFREKHNLHSYIEGAYPWFRYYINSDDDRWEGFKHLTHEEAESACLDELIEIVKEGKI